MSRCQYCEIHNEEYSECLDAEHYDDSCSVGIFSREDLELSGLPIPDDLYDGVCDACYQQKMGGTWISESFFKYLKSQITKKNSE